MNKHLPYYKMKELDEEGDNCHQKMDSNKLEQFPYCAKPFGCLNKHLPHCKNKDNDEYRWEFIVGELNERLRKAKTARLFGERHH